jgi:hypothetical protein
MTTRVSAAHARRCRVALDVSPFILVIPAQAGIHRFGASRWIDQAALRAESKWIPAFAGMTS